MAKEANLKKIELKVFVNCCEGCKRKVKKVLQGVEAGVLKTEIDPWQPRVTVLGDVDPQILIKRLRRAGKQAEVISNIVNPNAGKEKKEADPLLSIREKQDKLYPERAQAKKSSDSYANANEKSKQSKKPEDGGDQGRAPDKDKNNGAASNANSNNPEVIRWEVPVLDVSNYFKPGSTFQDFSSIPKTGNQYGNDPVKPYAIAVPIFAMPSLPPTYGHDKSAFFPQANQASSTARVGDYFSDDNAVGCRVM